MYFKSRTTAELAASGYTHRAMRQHLTTNNTTQHNTNTTNTAKRWYLANGNVGEVSCENDVVPKATHQAMAQGGGHFLRSRPEGMDVAVHDIYFLL